jgi:hypothetical protein
MVLQDEPVGDAEPERVDPVAVPVADQDLLGGLILPERHVPGPPVTPTVR